MLLDGALRTRTLALFDGLVGAWNARTGAGSHFVWANRGGHRARMTVSDGALVRDDTGEAVPIHRETVAARLRDRSWMPGQILLFSSLVFYAGIKPLMGWSREFVTRMRRQLQGLLQDDDPAEAARIGSIPLDNMNLFSILKARADDPASADLSALDIIAAGGLGPDYFRAAAALPVAAWRAPIIAQTRRYAAEKYG
jgi:hypothetical protein